MKRALALLLAAVPSMAFAASPKWLLDGAAVADFGSPVETVLYRGPETNFLPAVFATFPTETEEGETEDVTRLISFSLSRPTRVSEGFAAELGLKIKDTKINGSSSQITTIPEVVIDDLTLRDVRALVQGDGDFVLGIPTLPEVAVAILPSTGTVRIVPSADAEELVTGVGDPIEAKVADRGPWWEHGVKTYDEGVALLVSRDR